MGAYVKENYSLSHERVTYLRKFQAVQILTLNGYADVLRVYQLESWKYIN